MLHLISNSTSVNLLTNIEEYRSNAYVVGLQANFQLSTVQSLTNKAVSAVVLITSENNLYAYRTIM